MGIESISQHPVEQQEQLTFDQKLNKAGQLILEKLQMDPIVKGEYGDKYFSGEAASLYTLILGEAGAKQLLKIGWGKVSEKTFVGSVRQLIEEQYSFFDEAVRQKSIDRTQAVRDLPAPVYCVPEDKNYFNNVELQKLMVNDPEQYLREQALFVHDQGVFKGRDSQLWPGNSERNRDETMPAGDIDALLEFLEKLPSIKVML